MMKRVVVDLPAELLARLHKVAPGTSRKRSEFIRTAIQKALWDAEEQATANVYAKQPDSATDAYVDPRAWETPKRKHRSRT